MIDNHETLTNMRRMRGMERALEYIARACKKGVDQSDDELELFITKVREIASDALKQEGNAV